MWHKSLEAKPDALHLYIQHPDRVSALYIVEYMLSSPIFYVGRTLGAAGNLMYIWEIVKNLCLKAPHEEERTSVRMLEYTGQAELLQKEMKSLSDLKKWLDMHNIYYGDNFDKHVIKDLNFSDDDWQAYYPQEWKQRFCLQRGRSELGHPPK